MKLLDPDHWYFWADDGGYIEWRLRSGTIDATIHMDVPASAEGPILVDCITYKAELWTTDPWSTIGTIVYDSLEKAMRGCEEKIREYLEHTERAKSEPEVKNNELEVKNNELEAKITKLYQAGLLAEAKINKLEAELADRPVVFAIQHIDTKILAERGYKSVSVRGTTSAESSASVDLYRSVEEAVNAILQEFFDPEHWRVAAYTGRPV